MARTKKNEAVILKGNSEMAQRHIQNVEDVFIGNLNAVANSIKELRIGNPTKDMLIDMITNNGKNTHLVAVEKIVNIDNGDVLLEKARQEEFGRLWGGVQESVRPFFDSSNIVFNGMRINNPALFDWFEVDESGTPYLTDAKKQEIIDGVREYIKTEKGIELYHLQHEIVERIQRMHDIMEEIANDDAKDLPLAAKSMRLYGMQQMYEVKEVQTKNKDGEVVGVKTEFRPRCINFDPAEVEQDDNSDNGNDDED